MRRVLILAIAALVLLAGAAPARLLRTPGSEAATPAASPTATPTGGAVRAATATPSPSPTATTSAVANPAPAVPGGPGQMAACHPLGTPAPASPPHPYRLGDPVCDARSMSAPNPDLPRLHPVNVPPPAANRAGRAPLPPANIPSSNPPNEWAVGADAQCCPNGGGVETSGLWTERVIDHPTQQPGDIAFSTMHEGTPGGNWIEIGWFWDNSPSNQQQLCIFWSSGNVGGVAQPACGFAIAPGQISYFEIVSYGNNLWGAYFYYPPDGGWTLVVTQTLNATYTTDSNVDIENLHRLQRLLHVPSRRLDLRDGNLLVPRRRLRLAQPG